MHRFTQHTGRAVALHRSNVDTDQIVPSEFCTRVTKTGFRDALFARWRTEPGFFLDDPARAGATVLVTGPDFGTGSSREHAVWALRDNDFRVVISSSFGDIFRRNALRNGLLPVVLAAPVVAHLMARADTDTGFEITADLEALRVVADGDEHVFDVDPRARWLLLNGLDDIAVTLGHDAEIADYETRRQAWLPLVMRSAPERPAGAAP
jgi:3-isopropylmalate/(R)-2-methylmalate dehydratase small subunit